MSDPRVNSLLCSGPVVPVSLRAFFLCSGPVVPVALRAIALGLSQQREAPKGSSAGTAKHACTAANWRRGTKRNRLSGETFVMPSSLQSGAPFRYRRRRTLTSLPDPSSWRGLSAPRHSDACFLILFLEATWSRVPFPFWLPHQCIPRPPRHAPRGRGLRRACLRGPRPPCHAQSRTARSADRDSHSVDLPRRVAPLELLACGRKLRITCAVLSSLSRQGCLPSAHPSAYCSRQS